MRLHLHQGNCPQLEGETSNKERGRQTYQNKTRGGTPTRENHRRRQPTTVREKKIPQIIVYMTIINRGKSLKKRQPLGPGAVAEFE